MAIYDWPAYQSDKAFWPASVELRQMHNNRELESPLSGDVQTNSVPGARWGWVLNFAEQSWEERGRLLGLLTRLSGKQHRVRLFSPHYPYPQSKLTGGTLNLSGITTSASVGQFASSVAMTGGKGTNLLTAGRSFDNATYWAKVGMQTPIPNNRSDPEGGLAGDTFREDGTTGQHYLSQIATCPSATGDMVLSCCFASAARTWCFMSIRETTASSTVFGYFDLSGAGGAVGTLGISGANWLNPRGGIQKVEATIPWYRAFLVATKTNAATSVDVAIGTATGDAASSFAGAAGASVLSAWHAMLEVSSVGSAYALPRLLAGDWFSMGGQLFMAVTDSVFDDLGNATVEFRHPTRAAVASGSAVTLASPTSLYILTTSDLSSAYATGSRAPAFSVEFREVFA